MPDKNMPTQTNRRPTSSREAPPLTHALPWSERAPQNRTTAPATARELSKTGACFFWATFLRMNPRPLGRVIDPSNFWPLCILLATEYGYFEIHCDAGLVLGERVGLFRRSRQKRGSLAVQYSTYVVEGCAGGGCQEIEPSLGLLRPFGTGEKAARGTRQPSRPRLIAF